MKKVWIVSNSWGWILGVFDSYEKAVKCSEKNVESDGYCANVSVYNVE